MKRIEAAERLQKQGEWLLRKYKALAQLPNNQAELDEASKDYEANAMAVKSLIGLLVSIDDGETP